jgi:hypothetical protein
MVGTISKHACARRRYCSRADSLLRRILPLPNKPVLVNYGLGRTVQTGKLTDLFLAPGRAAVDHFVIIRLGGALGVFSAGEITKVTQVFQPSGRFFAANSP